MIFLDRDVTINKYAGFLRKLDEFELLPDAAKDLNIDLNNSYVIEDSENDAEAENAARREESIKMEEGGLLRAVENILRLKEILVFWKKSIFVR